MLLGRKAAPVSVFLLGAVALACAQQKIPYVPPTDKPGAFYVDLKDSADLASYLKDGSRAGVIISAHRGGPQSGFPENCLETFEQTLKYGPMMIECDVSITRDGALVLMHDETLNRTTTGRGPVVLEVLSEIKNLRLRDNDGQRTNYTVPTLREALDWSKGKAILSLDVKEDVPFEKVIGEIKAAKAENRVQIITYTFDDAKTCQRLAPTINQSVSASTVGAVNALFRQGLDLSRITVFTGVGEVRPDVISKLRQRGIRCGLGTFGNIDESAKRNGYSTYAPLIRAGVGIIATNEPWIAVKARS